MYSNLYYYYQVRSDRAYSKVLPSDVVFEAVRRLPHLRVEGSLSFRETSGAPWFSLLLVRADEHGNYAADSTANFVNCVVAVGSKSEPASAYEPRLIALAKELSWQAVLEEDEEGNEVLLWEMS